ncbi:MAG: hypothetical protein ACO1OO_08570 [Flavisolibacter sp.]
MYKSSITTKHLSTAFDEQTGRYSFPYLMVHYSLTEAAMIDLDRWMTDQIEQAERYSKLVREYPEMRDIVKAKGSFRPSVKDWYDQLSEHQRKDVVLTDLSKQQPRKGLTEDEKRRIIKNSHRFVPQFGTTVDENKELVLVVTENGTRYTSKKVTETKDSITNFIQNRIYDNPEVRPTVADWYNSLNVFSKASVKVEKFREPVEIDLEINPEHYH